jgi:hypothetical protein
MLGASYFGNQLPPVLIFQATPGGRVDKDVRAMDKPGRIYPMVSNSGFVNSEQGMPLWIEKVLNPTVAAVYPLLVVLIRL